MDMLQTAEFWIGLLKIIWINIILSGDNAVVIALAARSLPAEQQKKAIMFGAGPVVPANCRRHFAAVDRHPIAGG